MNSIFRIVGLVFICSLFSTTSVSQEWELINPLPTPEYLHGVCFLNPDTGFVCGQYCTLLRTTDGGESWDETDTLTYGRFMAITFLNNDTGFVVGGNSILRTNDCGENWITLGPHLSVGYNDVFFLDDMHGWVVGDYNTVIRTQDGGNNWEVMTHSVGTPNFFYRVMFISPDTGYICGKYGSVFSSALLKKTCDGGDTWTEIHVPGNESRMHGLQVIGGNDLYISIYNNIYHTVDNGQNWDLIPIGYPCSYIDKITFLDSLNWKVLSGSKLFFTNDGGLTWDYSEFVISYSMQDMSWPDPSHCYVAGQSGVIMNSADSGQTWSEMSEGFRPYFKDVSFINENIGVAVGSEGEHGVIYRTDDGGFNWNQAVIDTSSPAYYLRGIVMNEDGKGWICGWGCILRSVDEGLSWNHIDPGYHYLFKDLEAYQDKYIWAGGNEGKLIRSKDHGNSWEDISLLITDHIEIISFSDSLNGLLTVTENKKSGYTFLYKTNDGGDSWQELPHPGDICPVYSISNPDMKTIYLTVGYHGLIKSVDGGNSWIYIGEISGVMPRYAKFSDPETGIISMGDYFVAHTWDGGESWIIDLDKSSSPYGLSGSAIYFHDFQNGLMAGNQGLIKKYSNPFVNIPDLEKPIPRSDQPLIYPNPVTDKLSIIYKEPIKEVQVYSINGNLIFSEYGQNIESINTESLPGGTYIIEILSDTNQYSLKFLKLW